MRLLVASSLAVLASLGSAFAQERSCDELLLPAREVKGKKVGPASCLMLETDASLDGHTLKRLDVGLDGTVDSAVHVPARHSTSVCPQAPS